MSAPVTTLERIETFAAHQPGAPSALGPELFDLVLASASVALQDTDDHGSVRYLIFAHTAFDVTPSHLDAADVIRQRLGLTEAESFAVTQQHSASGLAAIDVAGELLRAEPDPAARALVVMGEQPASGTAQSKVSAACLVGVGGSGAAVRSYVSARAASGPATLIRTAADRAGLDLDELTVISPKALPRNGSQRSRSPGPAPAGRCADPFIDFVSLREAGGLVDGGHYLLTCPGPGSSCAAMVIEHHAADRRPSRCGEIR